MRSKVTFRMIFTAVALLALSPLALAGDRLLGTSGVSAVEGSAGGGLVPWAVIGGAGSADQIGGSAFATHLRTDAGYELEVQGVALGLWDRVELSAAQWRFGLSDVVPGQALHQDVFGVKVRVFGDAVYEADSWLPQVSVGAQYKHNTDMLVPNLLGARHDADIEPYVAAAKVWLGAAGGYNLLTNLTLRATRANQMGLLGFGGDRSDSRHLEPEASVAVLPRDNVAVGVEWRSKPSELSSAPESNAGDLFLAWWPCPHVSLTTAWVNLGQIAGKSSQRGAYVSLQGQF